MKGLGLIVMVHDLIPVPHEMATGLQGMVADRLTRVDRVVIARQETAADRLTRAGKAAIGLQGMAAGHLIRAVIVLQELVEPQAAGLLIKAAVVALAAHRAAVPHLVAELVQAGHQAHGVKTRKSRKHQQEAISALYGTASSMYKLLAQEETAEIILATKTAKS